MRLGQPGAEPIPADQDPAQDQDEALEEEPQVTDSAQAQILRRRIVRYVEKQYETTLSEDEREVLLNSYFGQNLSEIDQRTDMLFANFRSQMLSGISQDNGTISIEEPEKKWYSGIQKWFGKNSGKLKRIALTTGSSMVLRSALHLVDGLGYGAGTITGAVIGGIAGKWRAEEKQREVSYGYEGVVAEYNRISRDETDPERDANALAFIEQFLLSRPSNLRTEEAVKKNELFSGNLPEMLKLLAFYNCKAREAEGFETRIIQATNHGAFYTQEFRKDVRDSVKKAGIIGMKRGALIGAGIGALSDAVSFGLHWMKMTHLKGEYYQEHFGRANEISIQDGPDVREVASSYDANPLLEHIPNQHTDWGNALSSALEKGLHQGIQPPPAYLHEMMVNQGMTYDEAVNQLVHDFNFAQPLPGHNVIADGYQYDFNKDGLQHLIDNASKLGPDGHLDYNHFAETLKNADKYLTENFPTRGWDYTLHDQIPFNAELHADATQYAVDSLSMPSMATQSLAHGAAIGAGVNMAAERKSVSGPGLKGTAIRGHESGGNGSGGNGPDGGRPGARPETTPAVTPREPIVPETENEVRTEPEVPTELVVNWTDILNNNWYDFVDNANAALYASTHRNWDDMTDIERQNITNLIQAINENNNADPPRRFKIALAVEGDNYLPQTPPADGSAIFGMSTEAGENAPNLDLTEMRRASRSPVVELTPRDLPDGYTPRNNLTTYALSHDLSRFAPYSNNNRYRVELVRKTERREGREEIKKIWEGDDVNHELDVLAVDLNSQEIIVLDRTAGRVARINPADVENAEKINIYKWY